MVNLNGEYFLWPIKLPDGNSSPNTWITTAFEFAERARTEWLRALGVDQVALVNDQRRIFVVTETKAKFVVPARLETKPIIL